MATCEKCGESIKGKAFQWNEFKSLCWPCKKPMMDACLPDVLMKLKAEFESPASQAAIERILSDDPKARS